MRELLLAISLLWALTLMFAAPTHPTRTEDPTWILVRH